MVTLHPVDVNFQGVGILTKYRSLIRGGSVIYHNAPGRSGRLSGALRLYFHYVYANMQQSGEFLHI